MLADKNGVFEDRPKWIQIKIFPYDTGDTADVSRLLPSLVSGGFIVPYEVEGKKYYWIPTFSKHQRVTGKEGQSEGKYPLPPKNLSSSKTRGHTRDTPGNPGTGNRERILCPSFISSQYPKKLSETVNAQASAKAILIKFGMWDSSSGTLKKEFGNCTPTVEQEFMKSW